MAFPLSLFLGGLVGFIVVWIVTRYSRRVAHEQATELIEVARREAAVAAGEVRQKAESEIQDKRSDLNREFDWGLPDEEYSTLAGLILFESQRIPNVGQTYTYFGVRFEILKKQKNQISLVRVIPLPKEQTEAEKRVEAGG